MPDPPLPSFPCSSEVRMTRSLSPISGTLAPREVCTPLAEREGCVVRCGNLKAALSGPNPLEYALVFLVVVAGVLTLIR
jgi:hypothetical protein